MMKKIIVLLFIASFFSCKENQPVVPPPPEVDSARKVLIEEFTGVRCSGCPAGSAELENLLSIYGDNLVVVSIHTYDFGQPYDDSKYDFRTDAGEELVNYLGNPFAYPSAVINRTDFDGGVYRLQYGKDKWSGFIDQELAEEPLISVNLIKDYDPTTRELSLRISGVAEAALDGEVRLTVYVTETGIVDVQNKEGVGLIPDYTHKHVLRTTMTNVKGDPIAEDMTQGQNYDLSKSLILPEDWNAEKCEVIAFLNLLDGQTKEILQVEATKVKD